MRRILGVAAVLVLLAWPARAQTPAEVAGTISAAGADCSTATRCVILSLGSANGTGLVTVTTFTGTIALEITGDVNGTWSTPLGGTTSITTAGTYAVSLQGARWLRARASTLSSGTPTVTLSGTSAPFYGAVAVTSSALPTGAATETTLAGVKTGTDRIPALGQAVAGSSLPVVLPAAQMTSLTPPAAITNFATETGGNLAAIKADADKIPAQGQALSAASMPVVLPAAQITTLTPPAAITGFATSTKQSDGSQKTQIVDGSGNVIASTSNNLNVQCANCTGSGVSATDNATVTESTSSFAPIGGEFQTTPGTVTTGHQAMAAITAKRALQTSLFDASGNALLGSKVSASSVPVVIASDQGAVTVTANAGTNLNTSALATSTNITGGGQKSQIVDGSGNVVGATSNALDVNIKSGSSSGTQYTEDAAAAADPVGTATILVRKDTPAATVSADGDNIAQRGTNFGASYVTQLDSTGALVSDATAHAVKVLPVDATGTAIAQYTAGTQDGALGTITSVTGGLEMGRASAAAPTAVSADDDAVLAWYLRNGSQVVNLAAGSTLLTATSTSLNTNLTNSTIAVTKSGTWDMTNAGTFPVQGTAAGTVAHDAVGTGVNPLLVGGYASAAAPTDVSADGDATRIWTLRNGSPVVNIAAAGALIGATSNALDVNIKSGSSSGTQYTEDAAAAADPVGNAVILVRKDTPAATVSTDGDNIAQRGTNFGAAYVTLLDAAGSPVAVGGGTQYTQDAALTVSTTVGTMSMGRASAAVPTDVSADGDAVLPWYLRSGAQAVQQTYGGSLAAVNAGSSSTNVPRVVIAQDATNTIAGGGIGSAGSASTSVVTVQGISGGTVIPVIASDAQGSTTSGQKGFLHLGAVTTSAPTYTTAQSSPISLTPAGAQRMDIASISTATTLNTSASTAQSSSSTLQSGATANGNGTAASISGTSSAVVTVTCSVACSGGTTINFEGSADNGTTYAAKEAHLLGTGTIASSTTAPGVWEVPTGGLTNFRARISAYSAGTITVAVQTSSVPAAYLTQNENLLLGGTAADANSGNKSAQTLRVVIATDQPQLTNKLLVTPDAHALTAGSALIGEVNVVATATTTDSGLDCAVLTTASTNSTSCKGSAGNLYGYELFNSTTTVYWLRLYNLAAGPTCSSATGFIRSIPIPPAAAAGGVGGAVATWSVPVGYATGIGYCITGGATSTDNTNAAAGVFGVLRYK